MPNIFSGIGMASQAMRAFQRGLDVTGNNISNVNTVGYSRQNVDFTEVAPSDVYDLKHLQIGNGVTIGSVNRIRDMFLEARKQAANGDLSKFQTMSGQLSGVESAMLEPGDGGIANALSGFFDAWSGLGSSPNQAGLKTQVQSSAQTLVDRVKGTYQRIDQIKTAANGTATGDLKQMQDLANKIATLNDKIRASSVSGAEPNTLMDQRDQAIRDMSNLVNVQTYQNPDSTMTVYAGSLKLVDSSGAMKLPTTIDAATMTMSDGLRSYKIVGGSLEGLANSINSMTNYQSRLDTLASTVITQVNALHQTGVNSSGQTGLNIFSGTSAKDISLDSTIAANANAIATSTSGNAGDGSLAQQISALRSTQYAGLAGNSTIEGYYQNLVTDIGRDVSSASANADTHGAIGQQIDSQIQSVSGVSLDDEMTNMMRYQRSYQAAAKVLTMYDDVSQSIINMIR